MIPHIEAVDRVILPVAALSAVVEPLGRLGFRMIPPPDDPEAAPNQRCAFFGGGRSLFHLELASPSLQHPLAGPLRRAVEEKRGLCAVVLRITNLAAVLHELGRRGVAHEMLSPLSPGEALAKLAVDDLAGVPLLLSEPALPSDERTAQVEAEDGLNHALPVRRLDHLAAVSHNLEAQTHFWVKFLGIPQFGQVTTPTMIIRQFKIGDAIIELLGAASADSPIHQRASGLISMMSVEVADLSAAVERARGAGFTVADPAMGVLPGTIVATVPASETGGLAVQLLQYVS
jgi:catechol 2,3-dioxygenase-like lactoylglutathione lyase family enzyme